MGPYREATAVESLEAMSRDGMVRLEVAPRHTLLRLGDGLELAVTERFLTITKAGHGKKRSIPLDGARLVVARAAPTEDVAVWHEPSPGVVVRLVGIRQVEIVDDRSLASWRALDRLVERLRTALAPHGRGVERSVEIGRGADRVLIMDFGDRMVVHVRHLFRERPRRVLDVHADGTIVFAGKPERRIRCTFRFGVTTRGDFIRFADERGEDLGSIALPWITAEDRDVLASIIGERIERADALTSRLTPQP